jgi:hypothetical protein
MEYARLGSSGLQVSRIGGALGLSDSLLMRLDVLAHCPLCRKRGDYGQSRWYCWPAWLCLLSLR